MLTLSRHTPQSRLWLSAPLIVVPFLLVGASRSPNTLGGGWIFVPVSRATSALASSAALPVRSEVAAVNEENRLEGTRAKQRVADMLRQAVERLERVKGYHAKVRFQERIRGVLGAEQKTEMKIRHEPFAVYIRFVDPEPGREAIYAAGCNGNKIVAHKTDWTRRLIPRLVLDPTDPMVMEYARHPITQAGLANLTRELSKTAAHDLDDTSARTVVDRVTDVDGREWIRSTHSYIQPSPEHAFARVEVMYDAQKTYLPLRMTGYDWPEPGQTGQPELAERYIYDEIKLDTPVGDRDFDPENPAYDYRRG